MAAKRALSGSEPVAPAEPQPGPLAEPIPKLDSRQIGSETGASDPGGGQGRKPSAQDQQYTWQDGDRTMTVLLQPDLTVTQKGEIELRDSAAEKTTRSDAATKSTTSDTAGSEGSGSMPVFRSQSGMLMTLPGGVLLALDKSWSPEEADAFFERNGITADRVSELGYIANGFYVETEPGFPSLDLANSLAQQDGVRISTPNWQRDLVAK